MNDHKIRKFFEKENIYKFTGVELYIGKVKSSHHKQKYIFKYPENKYI